MEIGEMRKEMAMKKWDPGYVYIIDYGDHKHFKIGKTVKDPTVRFNQITEGAGQLLPNPLNAKLLCYVEVSSNPYYLEQLLHMEYASYHAGGEWFLFDSLGDLAELVAKMYPFGCIEYTEDWYSLWGDDFVEYVMIGVYPEQVEYSKDVCLYSSYKKVMRLRLARGGDRDRLKTIADKYRSTKQKYPDTFNGCELVVIDKTPAEDIMDSFGGEQ